MTSPIYAHGPETNAWPEVRCTSCGEPITPERGRAITYDTTADVPRGEEQPILHDECFRPCYMRRTRGKA